MPLNQSTPQTRAWRAGYEAGKLVPRELRADMQLVAEAAATPNDIDAAWLSGFRAGLAYESGRDFSWYAARAVWIAGFLVWVAVAVICARSCG